MVKRYAHLSDSHKHTVFDRMTKHFWGVAPVAAYWHKKENGFVCRCKKTEQTNQYRHIVHSIEKNFWSNNIPEKKKTTRAFEKENRTLGPNGRGKYRCPHRAFGAAVSRL